VQVDGRLEDDQVQRSHTIQVNNSASITWNELNLIDGQVFQLSPECTRQSPLAGLAESETSPSSSIPEADGDTQHRGKNCKS
jgi:hypothetical protein